jgi:bifunctional non-homologous end joining protein LigD
VSVNNVSVEIEGRRIALSNLDKVLYPSTGFTKAQVIDYYTRIAPVLLPHLRGHPLTLKRYPNGVDAPHFYEKNCPSHKPEWVATAPVWSGSSAGTVNYCLANDLATLVWVANLAALELHPNLAAVPDIARPLSVVFDLDPGAPADIVDCARVALLIRGLFRQMQLKSFVKTSGSKGMQLYVPLNGAVTYEETRNFSRAVAMILEARKDAGVVSSMTKAIRPGKVLVDWSQNHQHKTTVAVYSLRARPKPTVSAPVTWDEVGAIAEGDRSASSFEAGAVLERAAKLGDLFAPLLTMQQTLPRLATG